MALNQTSLSHFEFYEEVIEFTHAYQPIVDLADQSVFGYESLLRGPSGESPQFIFEQVPRSLLHLFEQHNRESTIARSVANGLKNRCLSLNFSIDCLLHQSGYLQQTFDAAIERHLPLENLVIEISEADVLQGVPNLLNIINEIRAMGATVALDDFGSGYAGLNSLIEINPDIVKLDMFLIRGIDSSGPRQATVRALVGLASDLGIDLIAEGIETRGELDFLLSEGISLHQGFLISRPGLGMLPEVDLLSYIQN